MMLFLIASLAWLGVSVSSCTYQLSYDAIVSPDHNSLTLGTTASIAENASSQLGLKFLSIWWSEYANESKESASSPTCLKNERNAMCLMQYDSDPFSFQLVLTAMHKTDNYFQEVDSQSSARLPILAVRIDVTMKGPSPHLARDVLVESIPFINTSVHAMRHTWSIQERTLSHSATRVSSAASLETLILSNLDIVDKRRVASNKATEIWQYHNTNYYSSMAPVRALFLNSTLRAITTTTSSVHAEAFVHPALIAHVNPVRIAIFSETPAAYVREILKYNSVSHITLVGVDLSTLEITKQFMPQLNDCTDILHVHDNCLDDHRINLVTDIDVDTWLQTMTQELNQASIDALYEEDDYLHDENDDVIADEDYQHDDSDDDDHDDHDDEKSLQHFQFDVILVDVASSTDYLSLSFHAKLRMLMAKESILVVNAGSAPSLDRDYASTGSNHEARDYFLRQATRSRNPYGGLGFPLALVYDEPQAVPLDTSFIILFQKYSTAYYRFLRNTLSAIDLDIVQRFSTSLKFPTVLYDGPTHLRYIKPLRAWEQWYCSTNPGRTMKICNDTLPKWFNATRHMTKSEVIYDPVKGRKLVTVEDVAEGNFILSHDATYSLRVDILQWKALNEFIKEHPDAKMYKDLREFIVAYGFHSEMHGGSGWAVSIACNNTFTNHACTEAERNIHYQIEADMNEDGEQLGFSPVVARRSEIFGVVSVAIRDLKAGEEIAIDYDVFRSEQNAKFRRFLDRVCGQKRGLVPLKDDLIE